MKENYNKLFYIMINIYGKKETELLLGRSSVSLNKHIQAFESNGKKGRYLSVKAFKGVTEEWLTDFINIELAKILNRCEQSKKPYLKLLPEWLADLTLIHQKLYNSITPISIDNGKRIMRLQ